MPGCASKRIPRTTIPMTSRHQLNCARPAPRGPLHVLSRAAWAALAAALLATVIAVPAQGQTEVWSATLTVGDLTGDIRGCSNSVSGQNCSSASLLSDDDFTDSSTDYEVVVLRLLPSGTLEFQVDTDFASGTNSLTLALDDRYFALSGGGTANRSRSWDSSGLGWSVDDSVSVKLLDLSNAVPLAPARPIVAPVPRTTYSLSVRWSAPDNTGRPAITGYNVRYRELGVGPWPRGLFPGRPQPWRTFLPTHHCFTM